MSSLDLGGLCLHIYIFLPPEWILWIVPSACLKLLSFSSVCSDLWLTPILIFCFNYRIVQFRSAAPFIICTSLLRFLFYSLIISWLLLLHCPHFVSFNAAKVTSLVIPVCVLPQRWLLPIFHLQVMCFSVSYLFHYYNVSFYFPYKQFYNKHSSNVIFVHTQTPLEEILRRTSNKTMF